MSTSGTHFPSSLDTTNPPMTTQGNNSTATSPPRLSDAPTAATQGSSATIGGAVGGAIALILTVVGIVIVWRRRNRGGHHQAGWFATGFVRRRRRQNLKVSALPITTRVESEHVAEKTRERRHQVDSPGPTVADDSQRTVGGPDSEVLAKLNMLIERVGGSSPGPAVDGQSRGTDPEVLAKLDLIMERVARLEEDRDREEAPPDYVSNRS
ncbi:hypothetical protein PQX77_002400 [Marasmius sp. AFHP31]|nr:hypothetical protein PQX77_002400 [Marasmius sp. AFHP31]